MVLASEARGIKLSEIVNFGNKEITFWWKRGTITGNKTWQHVSVSSYNDQQGNAHVSSSSIEHHQIWLVDSEGSEWCYETRNFSLPYHEGHIFDFLYAQCGKTTRTLLIVNQSTGYQIRYDDSDRDLLHSHGWGTARVLTAMVVGLGIGPLLVKKYEQHRWESAMMHADIAQLTRETTRSDQLDAFFRSDAYSHVGWGVVLLLFIHAWFRHRRPMFLSVLRRHIAGLMSQREGA